MVKINKVLLCGAKQVGKSAILEQLIYGHVNKDSVIKASYILLLCYAFPLYCESFQLILQEFVVFF